MVFPVESEERTLRNFLLMYQDHARMVIEIYRKFMAMIESMVNGETDSMDGKLEEIRNMHKESLEIKRKIMKELHETGSMLFNREDLYRLISKSSEVTDYIESMCVRLWIINDKKWSIPLDIGKRLVSMADASFNTLTKLRESLISLGYNPNRSMQIIGEVDESERKVDALFRKFDVDIITSGLELPLILTLRDVILRLEQMVDIATEEADLIRILSL
jgi:predicted phosphate transport protein (TIGR00153 family)